MRPPLSIRQRGGQHEEPLVEGIAEWMAQGARKLGVGHSHIKAPRCNRKKNATDRTTSSRPLDWRQGTVRALDQILDWLVDDEIGLNLLDHCLGEHADSEAAKQLEDILDASGSAWTVGLDDQNQF